MIQVFLAKRYLRKRKRNGQREHRWVLRWENPDGWRCESTGTADRTQAEALLKVKWSQLNDLQESPEAPPVNASWQECRDALERAMRGDNLRPSYVVDAVLMLDTVRKMFPKVSAPADITLDMANEFKRQRSESGVSPWTTRGDLATLKATFGKWLMKECGLLKSNPFASVKPPKCDDPDVRIVTAEESQALFAWLSDRWNNWRVPLVYLEVAALIGWRSIEIASIREDDLLPDGFVRVTAPTSKTRKHKYGWLPDDLYARVKGCAANGWAFGRFSDDLRRLLILWRKQPHHGAKVREFSPKRLTGWLQDELKRFNKVRSDAAVKAKLPTTESFTLHDFRRTAITGLQMAGVTEKEASVMVGATPEVIRKHYEKLDQLAIAKRSIERRLAVAPGNRPDAQAVARRLRAAQKSGLDDRRKSSQTVGM